MKKDIISFNAYTLNKPITGVGRYTQMLSYLSNDEIYKIGLCYNQNLCWDHGFNEIIDSNLKSKFGKLYWNLFSKDLNQEKTILHSPFPSLPLFRKNKSVITVHDLIFLTNQEWYSKTELLFSVNLLKYSIKCANRIICVSQFTKKKLIEYFPAVEKKSIVIYNCLPPIHKIKSLKQFKPCVKSNLSLFLEKKFKYFVCPSNRHPRKNLENTILGFKNSQLNKRGYKLVLTGLNENNFKLKDDFIFDLGYLSDNEYYCLVNNSSGIIYFPFKEGFGLPILDAMMFNKNVFISELDVFKEILPNHNMLSDIDNSNSITEFLNNNFGKINSINHFEKDKFSFKLFQKKHLELYDCLKNEI